MYVWNAQTIKIIKFNFILPFICSTPPNTNIGHVFQKCYLKALLKLLSPQWHQTSFQSILNFYVVIFWQKEIHTCGARNVVLCTALKEHA